MKNVRRETRLRKLRDIAQWWFGPEASDVEKGALIESAFLMSVADGELSADEHEQLIATIQFVTSTEHENSQIEALIDQFVQVLQADGWKGRLAAVARTLQSPDARRRAYQLAAAMSFIDGDISEAEQNFFGLMADAFAISEEDSDLILTDVRDRLFASSPLDENVPEASRTTPRR